MKKVFLEDLPKKEGMGALKNKQVIDWIKSIDCKVNFIYDNIQGEIKIVDYKPQKQILYIKYLNKEPFKIFTGSFQNCQLGGLLGKRTNEFKVGIGKVFKDNNRNFIIIDRKYRTREKIIKNKIYIENEKWYKYHCNICKWDEGWIKECELLKGIGCSCCCNRVAVPCINDISTTAPWMVKYFQGGYDEAKLYTKCSNKKIFAKCPDCGRIQKKAISINNINKYHSISCSCGDGVSYPFKLMFSILEQLKINFETEYSPKWIKPKRYDFYFKVNDKEYIIEMDGGLGHGNNIFGKSKITKEETKEIDDYKDELAKEHNIKVIRIDCKESNLEYIKNNILIKLSKLFNLNNIDWNLCGEFALSNLCKKVCEIKRNNPNITSIEIGKIMNLSFSTIIRYLKKGSKLDWCNYDSKEESFKGRSKGGKSHSKPIEMFKDTIKIGEFKSAADLERKSEERFNTKLFNQNVLSVCIGKRKSYKGFTFRYV